jgi:hypothetical protein
MFKEGVAATIRSPFFPQHGVAYDELKQFDADLEDSQRKVRLHDEYDDDADSDFGGGRHDSKRQYKGAYSGWDDDWYSPQKEPVQRNAGFRLLSFGVFLTEHGPLFGNKFLVIMDDPNAFDSASMCLGCISYSKNEDRRADWCNKANCTGHPRPAGSTEDNFATVDIRDVNNSAEHKAVSETVIANKNSWSFLGGINDKETIMGQGGKSNNASPTGRGYGKGRGNGKGKGKGRGYGGGDGKGKGKGKGENMIGNSW